jgi:hypothetical protein
MLSDKFWEVTYGKIHDACGCIGGNLDGGTYVAL